MPTITALVHTENDGLRIGRCLEMLYVCDDIVIVDHDSRDDTIRVARQYGARMISAAAAGELPVASGWLLCLDPRESISEGLTASLYEYKSGSLPLNPSEAFSFLLREETVAGWIEHTAAQTRLVPATWKHWRDGLPLNRASSRLMQGEILRFAFP